MSAVVLAVWPTAEQIADKLYELGWRSHCDAQHEQITTFWNEFTAGRYATPVSESAARFVLAEEALELARGVMAYCQGDAWEREATSDDRDRFDAIFEQLFPSPPEPERWPSCDYVRVKPQPKVACPVCDKKVAGGHGLWEHSKTVHSYAGTLAQCRRENSALLREAGAK